MSGNVNSMSFLVQLKAKLHALLCEQASLKYKFEQKELCKVVKAIRDYRTHLNEFHTKIFW